MTLTKIKPKLAETTWCYKTATFETESKTSRSTIFLTVETPRHGSSEAFCLLRAALLLLYIFFLYYGCYIDISIYQLSAHFWNTAN